MLKKAFVLYSCQIYKAVLPLAFTPIILDALGSERYGMIAFFYMLVGLLGILDAGVSGTFLKLVATNRDSLCSYKKVVTLFIKILFLFCLFATLLSLFFIIGDDYIVTKWLNTSIVREEAIFSVKSIGIVLAALYIKSYLSSFLNGMEKQEWITTWSIIYSSFFYFGSYYAIKNVDNTLFVFFKMMVFLAIFDVFIVFCLVVFVYFKHSNRLKKTLDANNVIFKMEKKNELSLKDVLHFSIQLSGLSIIWVIATQVDKFVLSTFIPLKEYANYQIAVQMCTAITLFSGPLTQLLLPRLSTLYSSNKLKEYARIYCNSMLLFLIVLAPIMPYFFVFGDDLVMLWMKDPVLGKSINLYAKWLVSAAFITAAMNFIFICLYSIGQLKHHFYAYAIYSIFTIPFSIWIAKNYGAMGSVKFLFFHSLFFMLLWGGRQIKEKFNGFIVILSSVFFLVIIFSLVIFVVLSYVLSHYHLNLMFKVFLPPLINATIIFSLFYVFRCDLFFLLSSIQLNVKKVKGVF